MKQGVETLWTHWAQPALLALLPWSLGFGILQKLASKRAVPDEDIALRNAIDFGFVKGGDEEKRQWVERFRMPALVDLADGWLLARRSDQWLDRWVDVRGAWPRQGPFLAVTFHWGAGLWALRHLAREGQRMRFVARRVTSEELRGYPGLVKNLKKRIKTIEDAQRGPIIWTPGASEQMKAALKDGEGLVVLCDTPLPPAWEAVVGEGGRYRLSMSKRFFEIARAAGVPVVPFSMWLDRESGRRRLDIGEAVSCDEMGRVATGLAVYWSEIMKKDDAAWTFWPLAGSILGKPSFPLEGASGCGDSGR